MNRFLLKKVAVMLVMLFAGYLMPASAQDSTIGKVSIASPNAASLGKYGDIPVSYHTGIPNISIPIYTVKSGSLQLPISMSYHAGGLKVQEQASWVGAGWTLNAGGAITRTVVGAPDDRGINSAHTTYGHFSDYGYNSYLFTPGAGGGCGGTSIPCPIGTIYAADDASIQAGVKDGEPDLYFFNFNGYTGKFYFNDDQTPVIVPEQDFKIVPYYPYTQAQISLYGILGFTITTPNGDIYYFGKNRSGDGNIDAMEITTDETSQSPSNTQQGAVSSWFLNKIVSADKTDSIKLSYQQDNLSYYALSQFPVYPNINNGYFAPPNYEYDLLKNFVRGVRLSKITFANGEVDLTPGIVRQDVGDYNSQVIGDVANTSSQALGSINITDNKGFCKKDSFYFGYFHDTVNGLNGFFTGNPVINAITSDSYRLRLDSIQETTCDRISKVPPYKFSYFSELVPRKLSFGLDHWGFYNGVTANQTLIPTYTVIGGGNYTNVSGADRDAHWPAMRGGALQQIIYPTGGSSSFVFEPNDTYVTTTTSGFSYLAGFSTGYGNNVITTSFVAGSGTLYQLSMTSSQHYYGGASLVFKDPSGNIVQSNGVSSESSPNYTPVTVVNTFNLTPGMLYTAIFTDNSTSLSDGASATLSQYLTTTTSSNVTVGGLRIKTITNNDALTTTNVVTSYAYNYGGTQSSGILYSRPVYVQELRNDIYARIGAYDSSGTCTQYGCVTCDGTGGHAYYASPTSIRPMNTTQGSHIGYNQVQVSQTNNGYSIYRYYGSNTWDNNFTDVCIRNLDVTTCDPAQPSFPAVPLPFECMRGELKYEAHYNQAGHPLKDVTYFPVFMQDSILTPGLIIQTANTGPGSFEFGAEYYLQSAKKIKDSTVSTDYDPASGTYLTTTNISYYNSPYHNQVTRKVSTTSTGDSLASNYKYVNDFRISNCDTISNGWHNYYASLITDSIHLMDSAIAYCHDNGGWSCKYEAYQQFRFDKSIYRQTYLNLRRTNYTNPTNNFATCLLNAENLADTLLKPIMRLQDEYINAPIEVSEWKDLNLRHAGFTKYDTSLSPVGYAYPGRAQALNLQTTSGTFVNASVSGHSIVRDTRYLDESIFKFTSGNPVQVTGHDGVATSYLWDYQNKEPVAKVMNATVDQVAYTSFESDGSGSWTIGSSLRDTTTAITGKSSYNLVNGACTRSGLTSASTYIVSYWSKTGASYTVTGSSTTKKGKAILINGSTWTYFEHTVTGTTSVSVTGSGNIDELRLYPSTAQMMTYTYSPLLGMTSQCDVNNRVTYYFYDGLSRLQTIRDQDYNVLKKYDYQYQAVTGCGANCSILPLQNLAGNNTLSYPVGVFNVSGKLLGNATSQSQYISLWNADTADTHRGTLSAGVDSMHFQLAAVTGQTLPASVTGCRYYQFDLPWTLLDGIWNNNAAYVTFGDGTGMYMGKTYGDTTMILPANTTIYHLVDAFDNSYYIEHTYPDTTVKTLTFYHNDGTENSYLDNGHSPAVSLSHLKNLRGNLPQRMTVLGGSSYQQTGASTVASIANWSSIQSITSFNPHSGDAGVTPTTHLTYAQDFMANNQNLQTISTSGGGYYQAYYRDTTFKISRLKSDWYTYFSNLQSISISDEHWNRENLSGLTRLSSFRLVAATQLHSNVITGNAPVAVPASVLDNIIIQIAAGAGQSVTSGSITLITGGTTRTTASDSAVTSLQSKGWVISITN